MKVVSPLEEGAAELNVCATAGNAAKMWTTSSGGQAGGCKAPGIFGFKPEEVEVTEGTALRGSRALGSRFTGEEEGTGSDFTVPILPTLRIFWQNRAGMSQDVPSF